VEPVPDPELKRLLRIEAASGACAPLLPEHGVYLFGPNDELCEFAGWFRETWGRLPTEATKAILAHWTAGRTITDQAIISVALATKWFIDDSSRSQGPAVFGQVCCSGKKVLFCSKRFAVWPLENIYAAIAHELAHVFMIATDEPNHLEAATNPRTEIPEAEDQCYQITEQLVSELCAKWGFGVK
jgi:hypothetical protein